MDGVFMKIRIFVWILCVALMASFLYAADSLLMQRDIAFKTIRLHVVANSDSAADQQQKLHVRDAVLRSVAELTAQCGDVRSAREQIAAHIDEISAAACKVLSEEGSDARVTVSLCDEAFETRVYDTFTLPAGVYPSLRVRIGAAEGKNWWCVVFPSLCTAASTEEFEEAAQSGGFSAQETEVVTGGKRKYRFRFRTLELLETVASWFS